MYKFKGHEISFIDCFFLKKHVEYRLIEIPRDRDLFFVMHLILILVVSICIYFRSFTP